MKHTCSVDMVSSPVTVTRSCKAVLCDATLLPLSLLVWENDL